jgi:hypothetical protein
MNTISNTSGAYTPPTSNTGSNAGTSSAALSQQSLVKSNQGFPSGGSNFNPQAKLQDSGNAGDSSPGASSQNNGPSGHLVGPRVPNGQSIDPAPQEAILPQNSPSGGTYTYEVKGNGHNPNLYRQDSSTGQWERTTLPSKAEDGQGTAVYEVDQDKQGNSFLLQINSGDNQAFAPGSFTPSGAPDSPEEAQFQKQFQSPSQPRTSSSDLNTPDQQDATTQTGSNGPSTAGAPPGDPNYVATPDQQLPTTGPNGETYTYSIAQHGEGDSRQQWLERDDGNGNQTYSQLPDSNKFHYTVQNDAQGHPYVGYKAPSGVGNQVAGDSIVTHVLKPKSLPPFEPHDKPISR